MHIPQILYCTSVLHIKFAHQCFLFVAYVAQRKKLFEYGRQRSELQVGVALGLGSDLQVGVALGLGSDQSSVCAQERTKQKSSLT